MPTRLEDKPFVVCPLPETDENKKILLKSSYGERISIIGEFVQRDGDISLTTGLGYQGLGFKLKDCRLAR